VSATELLRTIATALDAAKIPFMLTGSMAAAYYGAGRATLDIDFVIDPTDAQLQRLVAALDAPATYVSSEAASEALATRSMFNVIDTASGWKVDLIIRKLRPFSETEFARRIPIEFDGVRLFVASAEDVILSKLEWAKLGASTRQIEDVSALLRMQSEQLDQSYLERWIEALGLEAQWATALG
jgi:hypothetical protein